MPIRRIHLDIKPGQLLASSDKRTIEGIAIPADEAVDIGLSKRVKFAPDSITFDRENIPLLAHHDATRPVGRLVGHEWTADGWRTRFKVSAVPEGDHTLTLANDQVLGLSVGLDVPADGDIEETEDWFLIKRANCFEISAVSTPAFAGAVIDKVSLSNTPIEKAVAMPETPEETVELADGDVTVNVADSVADFATAVVESMTAPQEEAATESRMSRPVPQPVPRAVVKAERHSPYPQLFGGRSKGHSFIGDILNQNKSQAAADRLHDFALRFAVTTADIAPSDPATDTSLTITPPDVANPLSGIITTRSLPNDGGQPFYVLRRDNTGDTALSAPHVEGVEPALGDIGGWTRALVESTGVSGKVAVTREAALAPTTPDMEALVFQRMEVARRRAIEVNVATQLAALTLPAGQVKTLGGTNVDSEFRTVMLDLIYQVDGDRYSTAIVGRELFGDFVNSTDTAGRPLYPIMSPSNANGTTAPALRYVTVNGVNIFPVAGIGTGGYLLDPTAVVSWLGPVMNFEFDYEVAWIRLAHLQFQAFAVLDAGGVIRLTRAA